MKRLARTTRWLAPALLLAFAGCFKLARTSPTLTQYVLGGARVDTAVALATQTPSLTIGLRRLELADYLATPAIVVRRGTHQILTSEFHRWGEELGAGIARTVAAYLASGPAHVAVDVAPWPSRTRHDLLVRLRVERFEGVVDADTSSGSVHVRFAWDVLRPADDSLLARGLSDYRNGRWRTGDYDALVRELDGALEQVSRELGARLVLLGRAGAAAPP